LLPETQAAPVRPNFRVNLGAGTVTIVDEKEEAVNPTPEKPKPQILHPEPYTLNPTP
jgi:hypothetical protein